MIQKRKYFFFILFVLINILLKCWHAGDSSFSFDEIISVKDTLLDFGHIKHEAEWDNNPPFYYYCLWIWHQFIPVNEFNSRLLSVIFISFSIGLAFLFALRYFNGITAISSATLLSVSNYLMYYALEARSYSLIVMLVLISSFLFFRYVNSPSISNLILLSFVNFLIIYTHYISGIVVLIQYVFVIVGMREKLLVFFSIQTICITVLVLLRFTKKQFLNILNFNHKEDFWLKKARLSDFVSAITELYFNVFTACVFIIVLVFSLYLYKSRKKDIGQVELYCWSVGLISILFLFLLGTIKPIFLSRYLIFCIPFITMLVSYQLSTFQKPGYIGLGLLLVVQLPTWELKKNAPMDYRSLVKVIKENKRNTDCVIINTRDNIGLFEYYYNKDLFLKYKNIDSLCETQRIYGINKVEKLYDINFQECTHLFLVQSFHRLNTSNNPVESYLSNKLRKIYSTNFYKGAELYIFKNN